MSALGVRMSICRTCGHPTSHHDAGECYGTETVEIETSPEVAA